MSNNEDTPVSEDKNFEDRTKLELGDLVGQVQVIYQDGAIYNDGSSHGEALDKVVVIKKRLREVDSRIVDNPIDKDSSIHGQRQGLLDSIKALDERLVDAGRNFS